MNKGPHQKNRKQFCHNKQNSSKLRNGCFIRNISLLSSRHVTQMNMNNGSSNKWKRQTCFNEQEIINKLTKKCQKNVPCSLWLIQTVAERNLNTHSNDDVVKAAMDLRLTHHYQNHEIQNLNISYNIHDSWNRPYLIRILSNGHQ